MGLQIKDDQEYWFFVQEREKKPEIVYSKIDDIKDFSMRSAGYETKEELIKELGILEENCKECGSILRTNFLEPYKSKITRENICFSCFHWIDIENTLSDERRFIIKGNSYWKEPDKDKNDFFVGFGGHEFKIRRFGSEEIIISRNLWHQGVVPEHFKERIKDNAEFL